MIKFIEPGGKAGYAYFIGATAELSSEEEKKLIDAKIAVSYEASESLPLDIPAREKLLELGFNSIDEIKAIEDLTELSGIGKALADKINAYLKE